jgi:hypothetical protein
MSERTTEPREIVKGERIEWTRSLADYPASEWTLKYRFRNTGTGVNVTCTADGDTFVADLTAALSGAFTVLGKVQWQAWIEETATPTNTFVVDQGEATIVAGFPDSTAAVDTRSTAKKIVDAIDAAMLTSAGSDVIEYEVETPAGRRRVKKSRDAAMAERKYYAAIVSRENHAARVKNGGPFAKPVRVRM